MIWIALLLVPIAMAHCPVCTAAIGTATVSLGLFGVSQSVLGLLIGAFAVSVGMMAGGLAGGKFRPLLPALSYLATVLPLLPLFSNPIYVPVFLFGEPGSLLNRVYAVNPLLLFSFLGAVEVWASHLLHRRIKERFGVLFPYQGVAITLAVLAATSAIIMALGL